MREQTKEDRERVLQFITSIHYSKSMLKAFNSMTFIYNPVWRRMYSEVATLPVSFFSVKSMTEISQSQVSTKPMLFYNDASNNDVNGASGSILNVVADNIILQPKQYKLECIVPYTYIHPLMGTHYLNPAQFSDIVATMFTGDKTGVTTQAALSLLSLSNPYIDVLKTILKTLTIDVSDVKSFTTSLFSSPDYNKASLDAMMKSRSILKMKTWEGWRYKYVVITNMDITKDGTEKDVYQARLTLQEVPILTIRSQFKSFTASRGFTGIIDKARNSVKSAATVATFDTMEQIARM